MKQYKVAILGCGSRGVDVYGAKMLSMPDQFKIVSVCDKNKKRCEYLKQYLHLPDDAVFYDEEEFFREKRADILVIATLDRDHVRQCVRALELEYGILLEKPIGVNKTEIERLLEAKKKYRGKILVCYVLRYAPAFQKIKELLDAGTIGRLICLEALEQVAYWHQAHSFVRGNWRNEDETCSMIMQKCCHDLDIIHYYVNSPCKTVYSTGDLSFFNKKNQPTDAADRCADCKLKNSCPYSAENIYIGRWLAENKPENVWPFNIVDSHVPLTEESIRNAYTNNQYGRCVFACDNNVVDNQFVNMVFENGVKANLTMTAFTNWLGRKMVLHGTAGEIELNENQRTIRVAVFGKEEEFIDLDRLVENDFFQHGGGDNNILKELYAMMEDSADKANSLEDSAESHFMAIAAEKSRKSHAVVAVHDDE